MSGNLIFGQDRVTNKIYAIACDSDGNVDVNLASATGAHGLATEAKQDDMITHLADIDNQTNGLLTYQVLISQTQSNGNQVVKCMGNNGGNNVQLKVDANGVLETSGGGGGGDATAANQVLQLAQETTTATQTTATASSVASMDGKITICDTGAVGITSNTDPTKATSTLQTAGNASLAIVAGAVSGTEFQCDVVSSVLPSGASTSANQTLQLAQETIIAGDTTSLDSKITQGSDATLTNAQQVLVYGRDSGGVLDALRTDASGHLEVVVDDFVKGQATMANSFPVVLASDQSRVDVQTNRDEVTVTQSAVAVTNPNTFNSTSVDMRGYTTCTFIGNTTNSSDSISVQYSVDDTTYYKGSETVIIGMTGDFQVTIPETGARYLRISQPTTSHASNMTITCISSKK
jgi:hypothetical protein